MLKPLTLLILSFVFATSALARPEYATKEKLNCVSCHASPWGTGPRTVMGKSYGSHGFTPAKTSSSDLYYGSLRFIDYYATSKTSQRPNGIGIMEAAVSGNVPIVKNEDGSEFRGVLTYNMPTLAPAQTREAYMRWQLAAPSGKTPSYFLLGKFYVPFGLATDEHRAYTKIQTNSTINTYSIGAAFSHNFTEDVHLDAALVNDFQTNGNFTTGDIPWGAVANLRWNPQSLPLLFGLSGNYERFINAPDPYAGSLYAVLSVDRLTDSKVSGSLQVEGVYANHWNASDVNTGNINKNLQTFFIPGSDTAYYNSIADSRSFGIFGQAKYNLSHVWTLVYRFDYLALDVSRIGEHFTRNGFGFEAYLNSNLIWQVRYEAANDPSVVSKDSNSTFATQSDIFTMLRLWI